MRWNGALYYLDWEDLQYTIYDFSVSVVANTYNVGDAEVTGMETDLTWLLSESWTVAAAFAYNEGETKGDFELAGDVRVPDGSTLPNVPEIKYNLSARYQFDVASLDGYAQLAYSYTDESGNDIRPANSVVQDDYQNLNFRTGVSSGRWGVDLYANNLTDENDDITISVRPYQPSATTQRPRTIGMKFSMRFD